MGQIPSLEKCIVRAHTDVDDNWLEQALLSFKAHVHAMVEKLVHCLEDIKEILNFIWTRENLIQMRLNLIIVSFCY